MPYASQLQHNRRDFASAEKWYLKTLEKDPDHIHALTALGHLKHELKDYKAARESLDRALEINPYHYDAFLKLVQINVETCNWDSHEAQIGELNSVLKDYVNNKPGLSMMIAPHILNMLPVDPRYQVPATRKFAKHIAASVAGVKETRDFSFERKDRDKLTIGYMSADFRTHVVGQLIYDMFRHHDRSRYNIHAFSLVDGGDDPYTGKIRDGVDVFHDASKLSPEELADLIYENKVDILLDLNGYTTFCRAEVLAMEPAPVQAHYLGYPGSMGADFVPYVIADKNLLPESLAENYVETPVYLPWFFVASPESVSDRQWSKTEVGIPEDHFVFCCFNAGYKIDPTIFNTWMRILHRVEKSVLWLRGTEGDEHFKNLREAAKSYGIDPERLVPTGEHLDNPDYLSRYRIIDLFLDTLHYTAGSTAVATQWTGCPILTLPGQTNSSRMSTSICHSVGLTETICESIKDYEEKAVHFANNPAELALVRDRLVKNQSVSPLFDTASFIKNLEKGFEAMWAQYLSDERSTISIER